MTRRKRQRPEEWDGIAGTMKGLHMRGSARWNEGMNEERVPRQGSHVSMFRYFTTGTEQTRGVRHGEAVRRSCMVLPRVGGGRRGRGVQSWGRTSAWGGGQRFLKIVLWHVGTSVHAHGVAAYMYYSPILCIPIRY